MDREVLQLVQSHYAVCLELFKKLDEGMTNPTREKESWRSGLISALIAFAQVQREGYSRLLVNGANEAYVKKVRWAGSDDGNDKVRAFCLKFFEPALLKLDGPRERFAASLLAHLLLEDGIRVVAPQAPEMVREMMSNTSTLLADSQAALQGGYRPPADARSVEDVPKGHVIGSARSAARR